jgi:hypothetical protein
MCGDAPVAVRAPDLAARDLRPDPFRRRAVADQERDVLRLAAQVIELEHRRVGFPAVAARMLGQVGHHDRRRCRGDPPLARRDLPAMHVTALAEVRAEALAAPVLQAGPHPIELGRWKLLIASAAHLDNDIRHERMFAGRPDGTAGRSYLRAVSAGEKSTRRRRRSPAEAQREIIAAAEALLRERPFRSSPWTKS